MLKGKSKTVIEVQIEDLGKFVQECHDLFEPWYLCDIGHNDCRLFKIDNNEVANYDLDAALEIIEANSANRWCDVGAVLISLFIDGFIPPGNYLIHNSW